MRAKQTNSGTKIYQMVELCKALANKVFGKALDLSFRVEAWKPGKSYATLHTICHNTAGGDRIVDIRVPFSKEEVMPTANGNLALIGILMYAIPDKSNVKCRLTIEHDDTKAYLSGVVSFYDGQLKTDGGVINFSSHPMNFNCQIHKMSQIESMAGIKSNLEADNLPKIDTASMSPQQILAQFCVAKGGANKSST